MGKSLRSKWKRKMRAVKRIRYGAKELAKLKEVVANSTHLERSEVSNVADTGTSPEESHRDDTHKEMREDSVVKMDVDTESKKFKNLKDVSGNYPIWLHPRKIRKLKFAQKGRSKKNKRLHRKVRK